MKYLTTGPPAVAVTVDSYTLTCNIAGAKSLARPISGT